MSSFFVAPRYLESFWLFPLRALWVVAKSVVYVLSLCFKPIIMLVNFGAHWAGESQGRQRILTWGTFIVSYLSLLPFLSPEAAILVMFSLYVHEQFHGFGYLIAKVRYYLLYLGFLGAAAVAQDKDYEKMHEWDKSVMFLAGPLGSLLIAIVWGIVGLIDKQNQTTWFMLGGLNLTLLLFNLAALGNLDGGRAFLSMMFCLREDEEKFVAIPMLVASVLVIGYVFIHSWRFELVIFYLLLIVIGFLKTNRDKIGGHLDKRAMTRKQVGIIMFFYMGLLIVGALLYPTFPDWSPLLHIHPWIVENWPMLLAMLASVGVWQLIVDMRLSYPTNSLPVGLAIAFGLFVVLPGMLVFLSLHGYQPGPTLIPYGLTIIGSSLLAHLSLKWDKIYKQLLAAAEAKKGEFDPHALMASID